MRTHLTDLRPLRLLALGLAAVASNPPSQERYAEVPWANAYLGENAIPAWSPSAPGFRSVDGDDVRDVLVGSPVSGPTVLSNRVTLLSGRTGAELFHPLREDAGLERR